MRHRKRFHEPDHIIPLTRASAGQRVQLVKVRAGHRLAHRLAEMGLTPGIEMTIVQDTGGTMLLAVRNSRIALGRGMAHRVRVKLISPAEGS